MKFDETGPDLDAGELLGVILYRDPPRWKLWLARILPWYEPQYEVIGSFTADDDGEMRLSWDKGGIMKVDWELTGKRDEDEE